MRKKWVLIESKPITEEVVSLTHAGLTDKEIEMLLTIQANLEYKNIIKQNALVELVMETYHQKHKYHPGEIRDNEA
jgi:hypothetical protein